MAEDVQILEPLKSVVTMSSILSIIEKNETENSNIKDNSKEYITNKVETINSIILSLPLNNKNKLNIKYCTYPCITKLKIENFIENILIKSRVNARKNSGHYNSLPFCCDHSEESCPTTVITTTSAPSTASVNLDKEKVICSSHPESNEEKQDEKEKDEEKKYDSAVGINIDAVHRAVLRGSIVKLPELMMNEHPVTIYPGYRNSSISPFETEPYQNPETNSLTLDNLQDEIDASIDLSQKSGSDATPNLSASRRSSLTTFDENSFIAAPLPNIQETKISFNLKLNNSYNNGGAILTSPSPVSNGVAWDDIDLKKDHLSQQIPQHHHQYHRSHKQILQDQEDNDDEIEHEKELTSYRRLHAITRQSPDTYNSMLGKGTFLIRRRRKSANNSQIKDHFNGSSLESYRKMKNHLSLDLPKAVVLQRDRSVASKESSQYLHNISKASSPTDAKNLHKISNSGRDLNMAFYSNNLDTLCSVGVGAYVVSGNYCSGTVNDSLTTSVDLIATNGRIVDMHNSLSDLAPTVEEEDEELSSDRSSICGPLRKIENNISALLRGDIPVARIEDHAASSLASSKRPIDTRSGIYKSESAKEMLLSQNTFGPLPPSPPSSSSEIIDYNDLPLPPSPVLMNSSSEDLGKPIPIKTYLTKTTTSAEIHGHSLNNREMEDLAKENSLKEKTNTRPSHRLMTDELPLPPPPPQPVFEYLPPIIFTHRGQQSIASNNTNTNTATTNNSTLKSWSNDSSSRRTPPWTRGYGSQVTTPTSSQTPLYDGSLGAVYSAKRTPHYGNKRSQRQSPKDENRLQTSCSLPETPIFARGSDIALSRTPFRRIPNESSMIGCRTAPRSVTANNINIGSGVMGIFGGTMMQEGTGTYHHHYQHRSINHALASNELLRIAGAPQRGWYPKQRSLRPMSTDNIDRIKSTRVWDSSVGSFSNGTGTNSRKIFTLPSNLTPSFLNKSPREALRRVTSLLITRKKFPKENYKNYYERGDYAVGNVTTAITASSRDFTRTNGPKRNNDNNRKTSANSTNSNSNNNNLNNTNLPNDLPKKNIFKCLWKRTKRISSSK